MGETITLTDEQAYNYLHARMDVGDGENESRMRRQRTYMEAVYDKVIDRVKSEKNFLKDITDSLGDSVTTSMNGDDFGQIRETFQDGKDLGIHIPEGETTVGSRLDDGLEHTEFYVNEASLADIMVQLCNLKMDEFTDWNDLEAETEIW
jgi:anionic cell wall polymer biosynthesis LytR-Cps2A-Psr (LCP) family protein